MPLIDRRLASVLSIGVLCCGQDQQAASQPPAAPPPEVQLPEVPVPGAPLLPPDIAPMISMSLMRVDLDFIFANLRANGMTVDGSAVPADQRKRLVTLAVENVSPNGLLDAIASKTGTAWTMESGTVVFRPK